jgi:hypothetical protein
MKKILLLLSIVAIISSCKTLKSGANTDTITLNGKITELGMSTFQYGTHLISADDKTYALKSATVKLANFIDKSVTLKGKKVAGYPVDGGPDLIEVSEISIK